MTMEENRNGNTYINKETVKSGKKKNIKTRKETNSYRLLICTLPRFL